MTRFYRQFPQSSSIRSCSFLLSPAGKSGVLRIRFASGATYQYARVSPTRMAGFLLDSVDRGAGSAFARNIRGSASVKLAPRKWR
jgi:hypothetical protein